MKVAVAWRRTSAVSENGKAERRVSWSSVLAEEAKGGALSRLKPSGGAIQQAEALPPARSQAAFEAWKAGKQHAQKLKQERIARGEVIEEDMDSDVSAEEGESDEEEAVPARGQAAFEAWKVEKKQALKLKQERIARGEVVEEDMDSDVSDEEDEDDEDDVDDAEEHEENEDPLPSLSTLGRKRPRGSLVSLVDALKSWRRRL